MATAAKKKGLKSTAERVELPEFLTPLEFAKLFRVSRSTVQAMIDSGTLKTVSLPTADPDAKRQIRRIPQSEVERIRKSTSGR